MFKKFRDNSSDGEPYLLNFTQPNMAFTPRQIIEQFASGEVVAQDYSPTDDFYDDKYSDDELVGVTQLDDDFQARQHVIDFEIEQYEAKASANLRDGAKKTSDSTAPNVSEGNGNDDMVDVESSTL